MITGDERRVLGAVSRFGLVLSSDWPDVAAHLVAQGAEGEAVAELAGLPRTASPWVVDRLVSEVLADLAVPELAGDRAGDLVAHVFGWAACLRSGVEEFAVVRGLARLAPVLDYPGGVIADAYAASEWLDCACHATSAERDAAVALESDLRARGPLDVDPELLRALTASWF